MNLFFLIVAGIALYLLWPRLMRVSESGTKRHFTSGGGFLRDIVGESNYQKGLGKIAGPGGEEGVRHFCVATLVPEDDNPYDPQAIRVDIDDWTVGYLSRAHARSYRRSIREARLPMIPHTCDALIVGGWSRAGDDAGLYGVRLDLTLSAKGLMPPSESN